MTNLDAAGWLRHNLESAPLSLPPAAVEWLIMLWQVSQTFDDVADGDAVPRSELDACLWNVLVAMPQNAFFAAAAPVLLPVMASAILKWQASDFAERHGAADARSFVWRAGYYDVILMAVQLVHGPEKAIELAPAVMSLYGEKFEEYVKEFPNA